MYVLYTLCVLSNYNHLYTLFHNMMVKHNNINLQKKEKYKYILKNKIQINKNGKTTYSSIDK